MDDKEIEKCERTVFVTLHKIRKGKLARQETIVVTFI
jgi:hypothetical protein